MRLSEWVLAAYFTYVTALSQILAVPSEIRVRTSIANGSLLCCYAALLAPARWRESLVAQHLRNWIPLALMLLAYKEMAGSRRRGVTTIWKTRGSFGIGSCFASGGCMTRSNRQACCFPPSSS